MVVVVDDEDRENEGDVIMAAELVTPEAMAFIVKHGTGIVCISMKEEDLERLELPLMVNSQYNDEKLRTAFTVTVVCTIWCIHSMYVVVLCIYDDGPPLLMLARSVTFHCLTR